MLNTVSITTAPPIRMAKVMPMTVTVGIIAFLQRVLVDDGPLGQPLGAARR